MNQIRNLGVLWLTVLCFRAGAQPGGTPVLTGPALGPDGSFECIITNLAPGLPVVVEASTNLLGWTTISNNLVWSNAMSFSDTSLAGDRAMFYRCYQTNPSPVIGVVTTAATTTPSAPTFTVASPCNALRIWTGDQSVSEPYFYVYVKVGTNSVQSVLVYRWQARILYTGTNPVALGTSDGRPLTVAPLHVPDTTETVSGITGTANCDKAGPPIWSPSAPHVMLPANAQAFTINSPGSNLNVFISEYDGYHWTPTRWMQLEANRSATVRTSYPAIALANYIGLPLTITAPAGTIIGGTSATMSLPFPAITGTSWQCTNCVDFMNAVSNAVAGDEIVLQDGTYALSNNLAYSSFTANNSAGNRGFEGVTFRSYSGNRTNCIISRSANTNGGWTMDQRGGKGYPVYFKDLTFSENCTAVTQSNLMRFYDGSVWMQNVRVTGTNLYDTDGEGVLYCQNLSNNDTQNVYYLFCQFDNQSGRLLNLSGFQTNGPTGIGSTNYGTKQIICTDVFTGGTTADYHNVIVAYPITVGIYGGNIYDTQQYISTAAYNSTVGFFFTSFPQAGTTARSKNEISGGNLFACNWTSYSGYVSPNGTNEANAQSSYLLFNSFSQANGGSGSFYVFSESNNITALHNRFLLASGAGLVLRYNGATFNWNIVTNNTGGYGIRSYSFTAGGSPSTTQPLVAFGNTFDHCGTAIYSTNNEWNSYFTNNATTKCGTSMNTSPAGAAVMSSDFNTWNQTVAAAYQVNANDITDANAALDANYFPIAGGNCDGNGATNIVDYVGDSDPYGLVLIYKPTRVSRGARERPAVYPGAVLYPDIW